MQNFNFLCPVPFTSTNFYYKKYETFRDQHSNRISENDFFAWVLQKPQLMQLGLIKPLNITEYLLPAKCGFIG